MSQKERRDYRSLGEILADARSERKLTVQQVSEKTKIAPRLITSLENDEIENLSGPVYARGFLRSLCQLYGLDHAWMMSKLEAGLETTSPAPVAPVVAPPPPKHASQATPPEEEASSDSGGPSEQTWKIEKVDSARVRRIRPRQRRRIPGRVWGILLALLVLVALVLFGRSLFEGDSSAWTSLEDESAAPMGSSLQSEPESVPFAQLPARGEDEGTPAVEASESSADAPTTSEAEKSDPEPVAKDEAPRQSEARVVDSAGTDTEGPERVPYRDKESDGLPSVVRPDAKADQEPSLLEIRATGLVDVWVQVDDRSQHQSTLRAGDAVRFPGYRKFVLDISDNTAVIVELDGIRREPPWRLETPWVLHPDSPPSD